MFYQDKKMINHLSILNDPPKTLEGPQMLHQLISWDKDPNHCAIDFTSGDRRQCYSYKELQSCTASLVLQIREALALKSQRAFQDIVPILLPQSPGLYISYLAVLISGGAFCPININTPINRVKFITNDVTASILITTSELEKKCTWEGGPTIIVVDEFLRLPTSIQKLQFSLGSKPEDLAYVIHTSGSTGIPKGVRVSHLAVCQALLAHQKHIPPFKRFLQFAAPSFDISVFEIFFPLLRASTIVGCSRKQLLDDLSGRINELDIDAAELTPSVVSALIGKKSNVPGLNLLITIGEPLTTPIIKEFGTSEAKQTFLYGLYGPAEATLHCTIYPAMGIDAKPNNIGIPLDTVSTFIIATSSDIEDATKIQILPIGELGELAIGGPQLAQGYLHKPEQERLAFINFEGKKYYRTGDKARQLDDGSIEIHGRVTNDQVKIRGQRLELGEVEQTIYKHPGIKIATAIFVREVLIVFALVSDPATDSEMIMETCSKWLPKSILPSKIILRRNFPFLPSGKIDKSKLEAEYLEERRKEISSDKITESEPEKLVKTVLFDFLGPFALNSHLSAVGLDSLLAIKVTSKLRTFGFRISSTSVLKAKKFDELVSLCMKSVVLSSETSTISSRGKTRTFNISQIDFSSLKTIVDHILVCTPQQNAILSESTQDQILYWNWIELDILHIDDSNLLIQIIHDLSQFNPILRTGFMATQDYSEYYQLIYKKIPDFRFELVSTLSYTFDKSKDGLTEYPVRFQILPGPSKLKLLVHIHHALYDAWSIDLLLDDLDDLLASKQLKNRPSFELVVNSFLDWEESVEKKWITKDYWKDHLIHFDPIKLPNFGIKTQSIPTLSRTCLQTSILSSDVEVASRKLLSSSQSIFQAAYSLILSSYLGSSDICFGTVFSGRTLPIDGIENIIGPCFTTLPIRIDVGTPASLGDLVQKINYINRKHLDHIQMSLRNIKKASGFQSGGALFDTVLIWQQSLHQSDHLRKHVSLIDSKDFLEFNLVLEIFPQSKNIELRITYQQQIIPEFQINQLLQQIEQVTTQILKNDKTALSCVFSCLDSNVLSIENKKYEFEMENASLYSSVEEIATNDPCRPAISFGHSLSGSKHDIQTLSYSMLNIYANRIAHYLIQLVTIPNQLICLCLDKSVELYTCILAVTKIGAAWLPVIPDIPKDRLENALKQGRILLAITHSNFRHKFTSFSIKTFCVDEINFSCFSEKNPSLKVSLENIAYGIFTSGSTGKPKGVLITQKNILSHLSALESLYPATKKMRLLQSCSQTFDVSIADIFFTWKIGGCLCSATSDVLFQDLENTIRLMEVTHLSMTSTVAALIEPKNVPFVEFLIISGEIMTPKLCNSWANRGLWTGYGPTETTNIVSTCPIDIGTYKFGGIGYPLETTSVFVLLPNQNFLPAPRGGVGELCFGGSQIFHGYMDKTDEQGKILAHKKFGRIYRSGDYGRLMPDGSLEFLFRKDGQVKLRGHRIELGEINTVLSNISEISNCVTLIVKSQNEVHERLVCFWTSGKNTTTTLRCLSVDQVMIKKIYKSLESAIPRYMIPSAVIPISFMPFNLSGKIDLTRLINLFNGLSTHFLDSISNESKVLSDHQWSSKEKDIALVVAQLTKKSINDISADMSLFSLGFDSISAIHLSKILRKNFKCQLTVSEILRFPSVTRIAEVIRDREKLRIESLPVASIKFDFEHDFCVSVTREFERNGRKVQNILPCTSLQEAMLSAAELSSDAYCNYMIFEIRGNIFKIQKCWREMVERHEILRTCFKKTSLQNHVYIQVILSEYDLQFGNLTESSRRKATISTFKPPYSLDLYSVCNIKRLILSIHHALYDEIAISNLFREIQYLYHDQILEPPIPFSPFLKFLESTNLNNSDSFWNKLLRDCKFPKFKSRCKNQQPILLTQTHSIMTKFSLKWIEEQYMSHQTTLLPVLMTVWACVLAEKLQEHDICFGNVVSGRNIPISGIERLIAPCFNTIPCRLKNMRELSYIDAFRIFQKYYAEVLPFQFTPLRRIQSKFSSDGSRLFETLLILQNSVRELDSTVWTVIEDSGSTDIPLVCEIVPKNDENTLVINIQSYPGFIPEENISEILSSFHDKLYEALQNPQRQLLSPDLRAKILEKLINSTNDKNKNSVKLLLNQTHSENEVEICNIIAKFLDVSADKIYNDINLFRLGLDSINITQFASQLREKGYTVLVSDIFEHSSFSKLIGLLKAKEGEDSHKTNLKFDFIDDFDKSSRELVCHTYKIPHENIESIRPCTSFQQGLIARTIQTDGKEYFNTMLLEFPIETSVSRLKDAWITACHRHEIFRTGFVGIENIEYPFAMITFRNFKFPWIDNETKTQTKLNLYERLLHKPWSLKVNYLKDKIAIKFSLHHALYDAISIQMLFEDISKLYKSIKPIRRPQINLLLSEIIVKSQDQREEKKAFWKREENKIMINHFPNLSPIRITEKLSQLKKRISVFKSSDLEVKCRKYSITVQCALQAAWARLLAAYTGESSTSFGIIFSGRSVHEDADKIPFPSTVTIPARCHVSGTNQELLSRAMDFNSHVHRHQFTPLTNIQKWSNCPNGRIFDTLLSYRKSPEKKDNMPLLFKITKEKFFVDYVLSLEILQISDRLELHLAFKLNVIPVEQASIILNQFEALLFDLLLNPENACNIAPQSDVSLLSVTGTKQAEIPGHVTLVHEFVEFGALNYPKKIALEFATNLKAQITISKSWTYEELNQVSNQVANFLLQMGVEFGEPVAICFDKCPEASFAIIGILKVGCICLALDPNSPLDRLKFILEDSGTRMILSKGKPTEKLANLGEKLLLILDLDVISRYSQEPQKLSRNIQPSDISYFIYTSGTTGIPKGCILTHDNIVQFNRAFSKIFEGQWTSDSKFLQFASYHFDVSILEQFWSWSIGIRVVSAPHDLIFENISGAIQALGVTHIDLTPSLARLLQPEDVPSLFQGAFITGGEQLDQKILDNWGKFSCLFNAYGPTEVTIGCTINPRMPWNGNPANIGPAYVNVGTYVLKPHTELPVLRGGMGELCVSGKLVAKGYLNNPELTAQKFPTLKTFNEKIFRTGDLVRILHDGSFIFLGRADSQVKLRGQRLELNEVKDVIKKSFPEIDEVVVLILKHKKQENNHLVAFFDTHSEDPSKMIPLIKNTCKSWLPGYMIPSHFIPLRKLPLNANNKVDVKKLSTIYSEFEIRDLQAINLPSRDQDSWSEHERDVLLKISSAFGVGVSGLKRSTNLFELGLDSISMISFNRTLRNSGLKNSNLCMIRNNPSLGGLVKALLEKNLVSGESYSAYVVALQKISAFYPKHIFTVCHELGVENTEVESLCPCTPSQEGMIFKYMESEHPIYFNKFVFHLRKDINTEKLLDAWNYIISRLEILRVKFIATEDGFCQVVMKSKEVSSEDVEEFGNMNKIEALKNPFRLSLKTNVMTLQIFHGLYDEISLKLLLNHVINRYRDIKAIDYGPSFISSLPYGPLAEVIGAEKFWSSHFEEIPPLLFPVNLDYSENLTVSHTFDLDNFEAVRLKLGVTTQAIIQACWIAVILASFSASFCMGIVVSGREIELDNANMIVGPLFNTVPLNINFRPNATLKEIILFCQDFNLKMRNFQHSPLKQIQRWIHKRRKIHGKSEIFQILFNLQRDNLCEEKSSNDIWTQINSQTYSDYLLVLDARLAPNSNKISTNIYAHSSILTKENITELAKNIKDCIFKTLNSVRNKKDFGISGVKSLSSTTDHRLASSNKSSEEDANFPSIHDVMTIRKEISGLANVDEDTVRESSSIYELGLDSIDVIKLYSRLKKKGVEIPVSDIIKCQTPLRMAGKIKGVVKNPNETKSSLPDLSLPLSAYFKNIGRLPEDVETILPATPLQQSMINEMISSGFKRYFNVDSFRIREDVDLIKLKNAIGKVVEASPILRITFHEVDCPKIPIRYAQFVRQYSRTQVEFDYIKLDKGNLIESYLQSYREEISAKAAKTHKLLHFSYILVGEINYLVIALSHALYDGTSLQLIHDDIKRAYNLPLSPRPEFKPYLEKIFSSITEDAKFFWKVRLSNICGANILSKSKLNYTASRDVFLLHKKSHFSLPEIKNLCKSCRITLQTLGQTCWALVLSHLLNQLDIVFGSVLTCRNSEEAAEIMFPLMNTVVIRSVIHGSLREMLRYMQDMSDSTIQYQHFPLTLAQVYALNSRKGCSGPNVTSLFDSIFIYQGKDRRVEENPLYEWAYGVSEVEFPICVEMHITNDERVSWTICCKSSYFSLPESEKLLDHLESVLKAIVSGLESPSMICDKDGVSICGLPRFEIKYLHAKQTTPKNIPLDIQDDFFSRTELTIRKALSEISGVHEREISKTMTIYQLGLDSILILKLPALLRLSGINLSISSILKGQTLSEIAKSAENQGKKLLNTINIDEILVNTTSSTELSRNLALLEEKVCSIQYAMPATAGQYYMIRHWQASYGAIFYAEFMHMIPDQLNYISIESAWSKLITRHDILRTGFFDDGARILQVVYKNPPNQIIYSQENQVVKAQKSMIDLTLPPLNLIVETLQDGKVRIYLKIHHALYDAISLPPLLQELLELYHGGDMATKYVDFKPFVAQSLYTSQTTDIEEKWKNYLGFSKILSSDLIENTMTMQRTIVNLPPNKIRDVIRKAKDIGSSVDALFLAALAKLRAQNLQKNSSTPIRRVIFGLYVANRAPFGYDLSQLLAPTLNILPLQAKEPLTKSFEELALEIQSDIHKITSSDMVSASLSQIFQWTGTRVNFCANILKSSTLSRVTSSDGFIRTSKPDISAETNREWKFSPNLHKFADSENTSPHSCTHQHDLAYPQVFEFEIHHCDNIVGVTISAPYHLISTRKAQDFADEFIQFFKSEISI